MKLIISIITILLFSFSAFGQVKVATTDDGEKVILKPNKTWEYAVKQKPQIQDFTVGWTLISRTENIPEGLSYYRKFNGIKSDALGDKSTWLRAVPMYPSVFNKKNKLTANAVYFQVFLTAHCRSERYSLESRVFYNKKNQIIQSNQLNFFSSETAYQKVIPDTIAESWFESLCNN